MAKKEQGHEMETTPQQRDQVEKLPQAELEDIDANLLENTAGHWSKVSRIILATMIEREEGVTGLPEIFFVARIRSLVKEGLLELQGDLSDMHTSYVRRTEKK